MIQLIVGIREGGFVTSVSYTTSTISAVGRAKDRGYIADFDLRKLIPVMITVMGVAIIELKGATGIPLNHIQSWSETAQSHLAEVEDKLKEATSKRDDLVTREKSSASRGNDASSQDYSHLLESLQKELDNKNEQLERMQDQLIEDADENEAKINQLLDDCEAEKQRAEGLSHEKSSLSAAVEKLSLEKEHLSRTLSEKQSLIDSTNAGNDDAGMRVEEAQRRISDLEAALCASESQVCNLMALKEQITIITAERDEIQSQLNHISEEYKKNQLFEHDNISL